MASHILKNGRLRTRPSSTSTENNITRSLCASFMLALVEFALVAVFEIWSSASKTGFLPRSALCELCLTQERLLSASVRE